MSFGPVCAIVSIRSTTSSGVGTQMTSLPAWPTWGSNFGWAAAPKESSSAATKARVFIWEFSGKVSRRKCSRKVGPAGETPVGPTYSLQCFRRVIGQARALAARERDVPGVRPALHAIDHVGEARAALG